MNRFPGASTRGFGGRGFQTEGDGDKLERRLGVAALGIVLLLGVFVYSTAQFGLVHGEEFSPQSFQRRSFTYYEIPLVGIQISPIDHNDTTGALEEYLVKEKILSLTAGSADRWDLVRASRGQTLGSAGDAEILCNYLAAKEEEDKITWLLWTEQHREAADFLWPIVAKLAEQELYVLVPHLFSIARNEPDLEQFKRQIEETLTRLYVELGENQQELDQHVQAAELFGEALVYSPDDTAALEGRAESLANE